MIDSWWKANELEFVVWGAIIGLLCVVWLIESLVDIRAERKQRRKDGLL